MYAVLIVDDESLARSYIKKLLDETSIAKFNVFEADCANRAIEIVKNEKIDIILVDIRMPGMDGLSLLSYIRDKLKLNIRSVIISGFEDFNYVKKALALKSFDYLLKPVKAEDLDKSLSKVIKSIHNDSTLRFASLIDGTLSDTDSKNIVDDSISYRCLYIRLLPTKNNLKIKIKELISYLNNHFSSFNVCECIVKGKFSLIVLLGGKNLSFLKIKLTSLSSYFETNIIDYSIGVGTEKSNMNEISNSYKEAESASFTFLLIGKNNTSYYSELSKPLIGKEHQYFKFEKSFYEFLETNPNKTIALYNNFFIENPKKSILVYKALFDLFTITLERSIVDCQLNINIKTSFNNMYKNATSLNSIHNYFTEIINELIDSVEHDKCEQLYQNIKDAMHYIENNYSNQLTLSDLADHYHVNKNYFCDVFKQSAGISPISYLNKVRIENAKQLLCETDIKIQQISAHVGFQNENYFSLSFKKHTGLSPRSPLGNI